MPRGLRTEEAGAIHHVYARGNRGAPMFLDDRDRRRYLRVLGDTVAHRGWNCLAYCLMTNHVHLLVETPQPNLGHGMQRLHGAYASGFNKRHTTVGHVFQGRYGAKRIKDDVHLITVARYIDANPVEAGLAVTPDLWPWSSRALPNPRWLADRRLQELLGL